MHANQTPDCPAPKQETLFVRSLKQLLQTPYGGYGAPPKETHVEPPKDNSDGDGAGDQEPQT